MNELKLDYGVSERRACGVIQFARSTNRYESVKDDQITLQVRIKEIAVARVRFGYRRIHVMLQREGWEINHKRVYRLYKQQALSLRFKRPKRHVAAVHRQPGQVASSLNEVWGMDFVSDELFNGRKIRLLPVIDLCSRECLALHVANRLSGNDVANVLDLISQERGLPGTIRCDNGPEFISKALDKWCYEHGVKLDFSRPGKPTDNAFVESFNGRLREECLNTHWFESIDDARAKLSSWKEEYNFRRPHSALDFQTPSEFAAAMLFFRNNEPKIMPNSQV